MSQRIKQPRNTKRVENVTNTKKITQWKPVETRYWELPRVTWWADVEKDLKRERVLKSKGDLY